MESKNNKNGNKLKKKLHEMAEAFAINRFLKTPLHKYQTFPKEKCLTWANVCHLKNDEFF